jgi:hypothetical protein
MSALRVVELKRVSERFEHGVRDAGRVSTLEALVVLDAHAGKRGDFFAAQAGHLAAAVAAQPNLFGTDLGAPAAQEVREFASWVHGVEG